MYFHEFVTFENELDVNTDFQIPVVAGVTPLPSLLNLYV